MKTLPYLVCLLLLAIMTGCEPKERAQWSPDGERAAVILDHRLHLVDPDGEIVAVLPGEDNDPGRLLVENFDWFPDGSGLVVHRLRVASHWDEIKSFLPADETASVESLIAQMPELLRAAVLLHGDADRVEILLSRLAPEKGEAIGNAFRHVLATNPQSVKAALVGAPQALASLENLGEDETGIVIHELVRVDVTDQGIFGKVAPIVQGLRGYQAIRISPQFPYLATARSTSDLRRVDLEIQALDGSSRQVVQRDIANAFDWTIDGRNLAFLAPLSQEGGTVMHLRRAEIVGSNGTLLKSKSIGWKIRDLAMAIMPFSPRVTTLPNGRLLFASQPSALPIADGDAVGQPRLFTISSDGGPLRPVPTVDGVLPMDLGYFVPSPDGRRVAVVESGTDAVAVVDLETGESELISKPHPNWKCRTLPAWKSSDALSFATVDPSSGALSWRLHLAGEKETKNLSETWSAGSVEGWLESKELKPEGNATDE